MALQVAEQFVARLQHLKSKRQPKAESQYCGPWCGLLRDNLKEHFQRKQVSTRVIRCGEAAEEKDSKPDGKAAGWIPLRRGFDHPDIEIRPWRRRSPPKPADALKQKP